MNFNWKTLLVLLLILFTQVVLRAPFHEEPLSRYEGLHAYAAQSILRGESLYRDVFSSEQPGTAYIYALAFGLFGESVGSVRTMATIASLLTTMILFVCALILFNGTAALFAAALFAFFSGAPLIHGTSAVPETFAILFSLLGVSLYYAADKWDKRLYIISGLALALAFYTKQVTGLLFLFFALSLLFAGEREKRGRNFAFLSSGFLALCVPVTLWLLFSGLYADHAAQTVSYNLSVSLFPLNPMMLFRTLTIALNENALLWVLSLTGLLYIFIKERERRLITLAVFMGASLLGMMAKGFYHNHNYILLLPPMTLLSGYTLTAWKKLSMPLLANIFMAIIVVSSFLAVFYIQYPVYTVYGPEQISEAKFNANDFNTAVWVGEQLRHITGKDDTIFVCGSEPELLFYARRRSASRYIIAEPAFARRPFRDMARGEMLRDVMKNRPKFIVWTIPQSMFLDMFYLTVSDYDKYSDASGWKIYKRKEGR